MRYTPYVVLLCVVIGYVGLVAEFGYHEAIALGIHFSRTAIVLAVLIMFVPSIRYMFNTKPYRNSDFLLGGIILTELSNISFSVWNEMFRIFGVDSSIFTSPVSGFFSLMLALGGVSLLLASDVIDTNKWVFALVVALMGAAALAFIAPMFR